ncbi:MAG TPA: bifunctional demethylmenaquinone methyltransferase/2-methoxy-6-polyprenyl-1,4-benzoquinol methylase, partial [Cyanobacteria bacterium UBA8156]|nr:bifunctional demethylmenaquinone methyltransferase/2-methoxy-6-polyprenyl-1,4-benzoquinol methylase [Cyanobacteria bacterium UBA8156]
MTTPQAVQALFDRIAPVYDDLNDRLSFGLHRVWKKMAIAWVNPQPQGQYLDLCCGSGDVALGLGIHPG